MNVSVVILNWNGEKYLNETVSRISKFLVEFALCKPNEIYEE